MKNDGPNERTHNFFQSFQKIRLNERWLLKDINYPPPFNQWFGSGLFQLPKLEFCGSNFMIIILKALKVLLKDVQLYNTSPV